MQDCPLEFLGKLWIRDQWREVPEECKEDVNGWIGASIESQLSIAAAVQSN
jgi:hypothetical protein